MRNFIEGYLADPAQAISDACVQADKRFGSAEIDDEMIYKEIATPEFRLYTDVILADESANYLHVSVLASAV